MENDDQDSYEYKNALGAPVSADEFFGEDNDYWKLELKLSVGNSGAEIRVFNVITETTMKLPVNHLIPWVFKDLEKAVAKHWQEFDGCRSIKEVSDRLIELGKLRAKQNEQE